MAKSVSKDNKQIAKLVGEAFGGPFSVIEFVHNLLPLKVDLLRCPDRPGVGVTSVATIGLSDTPLYLEGQEYPVRVELVGAVASNHVTEFGSVLGTATFCIMRSMRIVHPGSVLENVVTLYVHGCSLPHLYLTSPFLWEQELKATQLETKKVAWLLAFPIFQAELMLLSEQGSDVLEDTFERCNIDIFDLFRTSVV